jgi:hypothetical protein
VPGPRPSSHPPSGSRRRCAGRACRLPHAATRSRFLDGAAQRQPMAVPKRRGADRVVGGVGGKGRHRKAACGTRRLGRASRLAFRQQPGRHHAGQHPVARRLAAFALRSGLRRSGSCGSATSSAASPSSSRRGSLPNQASEAARTPPDCRHRAPAPDSAPVSRPWSAAARSAARAPSACSLAPMERPRAAR